MNRRNKRRKEHVGSSCRPDANHALRSRSSCSAFRFCLVPVHASLTSFCEAAVCGPGCEAGPRADRRLAYSGWFFGWILRLRAFDWCCGEREEATDGSVDGGTNSTVNVLKAEAGAVYIPASVRAPLSRISWASTWLLGATKYVVGPEVDSAAVRPLVPALALIRAAGTREGFGGGSSEPFEHQDMAWIRRFSLHMVSSRSLRSSISISLSTQKTNMSKGRSNRSQKRVERKLLEIFFGLAEWGSLGRLVRPTFEHQTVEVRRADGRKR